MPNTFELIASSTVGSGGAASIDFTSIPSTYTDLCLKISTRANAASVWTLFAFNGGSSSDLAMKSILGYEGTTVLSQGYSSGQVTNNPSTFTSNTFSNAEIYIPNYAGSTNKSVSSDSVMENNATSANQALAANLWSNTAAINRITLTCNTGNFVQYSTAYLYGVKNA